MDQATTRAASAPADQVSAAPARHPAPGHLAVTRLDEAIAWVTQLPIPTRGACTMIAKLREARAALLATPTATNTAGAVPEGWRGIKAVLTNLIAVASVRITNKDDEDDQLIADAAEAVRQLEAGFAAAPSAPALAEPAPVEGQVAWGIDLQARLIALGEDQSDEVRNLMAEAACLLADLVGRSNQEKGGAQ